MLLVYFCIVTAYSGTRIECIVTFKPVLLITLTVTETYEYTLPNKMLFPHSQQ